MGTCLSKKKGSSTSSPLAGAKSVSTAPTQQKNSGNGVTVALSKPEISIKKKNTVQEEQDPEVVKEQEDEGQVKKEIFIIKHRKSHDDRERNSKIQPCTAQHNVAATQPADGLASPAATTSDSASAESMGNKVALAPSTPNMGVVGVRTSSCTREEVDAILIQCGRLSRSSSGKAASSSGGRKYSGSKRSYDFDHCDNDAISAEDDQKRANASDNSEEYDGVAAAENGHRHHQHRQRHRQSPRRGSSSSSSQGRRRTPSRERDQQQQQQQRSSSRERRVSRSPGRRSSETNNTNTSTANASSNNTGSRPGKMVSVPATVSSLVMDKSNNGSGGGGEPAKRITAKRNVGDNNGMVGSRSAASPRSRSPARANGNAAANAKVLSENQQQQQQPSLSRNNSSRKTEQSPYRRNPLSEVDPNSLAYPQSNTNNGTSKVQNKPKREIEVEGNQKPSVDMNDNSRNRTVSRVALEKGVTVSANCHTKEQQEEEIKVMMSSVPDNAVVKRVVMMPSGVDNPKPQTLTRSRSCRRSRDLDINPEALLNPTQFYTSLLLEDIQNFHQKNTQPSVSLPACLNNACSILEAVADFNPTTSSNFSGAFSEDRKSPPPTCQSIRNEYNVHYGKRVADTKDPFVESEVVVSDDVMEPSLHKYVTVKRGGSLVGGVDMEDQESSGSNSFTVSSGQQHWGISSSSSSWEPNSADSTDCWTSRLNSREEGQKCPLGLDGCLSSEANKKTLNSKRRECDHQHSSGIGRGRLGSNKGLHSLPVVTAAAST